MLKRPDLCITIMNPITQFLLKTKRTFVARTFNSFIGVVGFNLLICPLLFCELCMPKITKKCHHCGIEFTREVWKGYEPNYCSCNCSNTHRKLAVPKEHPFCACGCGKRVSQTTSTWLPGHNSRGRVVTWGSALSKALIGKKKSEQHCANISKGRMGLSCPTSAKKKLSTLWLGIPKGPNTSEHNANISAGKMGHEVSKKTREKLSQAAVKQFLNNDCYGFKKFFSNKNQKNIYYQSSYELVAFQQLESDDEALIFSRCPFGIPYFIKGNKHNYLPDIFVTYKDGSKLVIEIKPSVFVNDPVNIAKWKSAIKYCKKEDYIFKVWTEKELGIKV